MSGAMRTVARNSEDFYNMLTDMDSNSPDIRNSTGSLSASVENAFHAAAAIYRGWSHSQDEFIVSVDGKHTKMLRGELTDNLPSFGSQFVVARSYDTVMFIKSLDKDVFIWNVTKYSITTTSHQTLFGAGAARRRWELQNNIGRFEGRVNRDGEVQDKLHYAKFGTVIKNNSKWLATNIDGVLIGEFDTRKAAVTELLKGEGEDWDGTRVK